LLFDNVTLVAADANNEGHAEWVDLINCRNRIFITINEDDSALMASRMKPGATQKARLGTICSTSTPDKAIYVNFTGARLVGDSTRTSRVLR
jgi:hypothetical protein